MTSPSTKGALCFIPARGGSKRIPGKNLRPLGGKPLLQHAIDLARSAALFEQIVVSSDDSSTLEFAEQHGVEIDQRPAELGADRARVVEVVAEFLQRDSARWSRVMVLQPPAPFRTLEDVHGAWKLLDQGPFVVSVTRYAISPELALSVDDAGRAEPWEHAVYARSTQSQVLRPAWHPNGAIYALEVARFLAVRSFFGEPLRAWVMPPERSLDLDEPHQWEVAEALWKQRS